MKIRKIYIILIVFLIVTINCKRKSAKNDISKSKKEIVKKVGNKNTDKTFNLFLESFSKDSLFQISRVKFPFLKREWIDPEKGIIEKYINKKDYVCLNFNYPKDALTRKFDRYTQKIKVDKNKIIIEIRGVENGIYADYFFEKICGRWLLISCNEQST